MSSSNTPRAIAHDLNNVLAGIRLNLDWLASKKPGGETGQVLEELQASCRRGAELVEQLFELFPAEGS
jgi:signal transduction histidine kinase